MASIEAKKSSLSDSDIEKSRLGTINKARKNKHTICPISWQAMPGAFPPEPDPPRCRVRPATVGKDAFLAPRLCPTAESSQKVAVFQATVEPPLAVSVGGRRGMTK